MIIRNGNLRITDYPSIFFVTYYISSTRAIFWNPESKKHCTNRGTKWRAALHAAENKKAAIKRLLL
jgi:hypothetical protein